MSDVRLDIPSFIRCRSITYNPYAGFVALTSDRRGKLELLSEGFRDKCGQWEILRHQGSRGEYVNIKAWTGKFLSACPDGMVTADREEASTWEQWKEIVVDQHYILFQSFHGGYLCVKEIILPPNPLVRRYFVQLTTHIDQWAQWRIYHDPEASKWRPSVGDEAQNVPIESDNLSQGGVPIVEPEVTRINPEVETRPVYIRSRRTLLGLHSHPALSSWPDGCVKGNSFGRGTKWEEWEVSRLVDARGEYVNIKAWTGKFLSASPNGVVTADRDEALAWERWTETVDDDGHRAFQSFHGGYLSNRGDWYSTGEVLSLAPQVDLWELWSIEADPSALTNLHSLAEAKRGLDAIASSAVETGAFITRILSHTFR